MFGAPLTLGAPVGPADVGGLLGAADGIEFDGAEALFSGGTGAPGVHVGQISPDEVPFVPGTHCMQSDPQSTVVETPEQAAPTLVELTVTDLHDPETHLPSSESAVYTKQCVPLLDAITPT
jgi:hypothetical protein